jgi:hypothetical protein
MKSNFRFDEIKPSFWRNQTFVLKKSNLRSYEIKPIIYDTLKSYLESMNHVLLKHETSN